MTTATDPHVVVLLATYNGADHLEEQLTSIAEQDHTSWQILASDDGSTDQTREILDRFAASGQPLTWLPGPGRGATENFRALIRQLRDLTDHEHWVAFSDQDDVWLTDRLSRGINALKDGSPERPALYCSRTWITNEDLTSRRLSPLRPRPLGFRNALVQNVAAGNTILLNPAAARLAAAAASESGKVVVHDWWIYQLVAGAGGRLVHDDAPTLLYRQHAVNQIGANDSARARLKRLAMILQGHFRDWNDINIAALDASAHRLAPDNRDLLAGFAHMRRRALFPRLYALARLRLYRQGRLGTLALWLSAVLGRI